jgi:predicted secreted protein
MSESAVYDSARGFIYISNVKFTGIGEKDFTIFNECISQIDIDGNIHNIRWIDSLLGTTGITIFNDRLYAVERGFLAEIDIRNQKIIRRYPIPDFGFPNDIAFEKNGFAYITDSEKNCIYRFDGKTIEKWLSDSLFTGINGLYMILDTLIVGNHGKNNMFKVALKDKTVVTMARNAVVFVDGIAPFNHEFIITGGKKIKIIDNNGNSIELMDSNNENEWYGDFYFIQSKDLLIVPTLFTNKVVAFKLTEK